MTTLTEPREILVTLAGNPNVGKTTLFNALTGLRQKVANYPGVTVERKEGRCDLGSDQFTARIIDLPGTYSLVARSPDELVARQVVLGEVPGLAAPEVIVAVADASNLDRNLYLVTQLLELGKPTVVALTMTDVAAEMGVLVNAAKLQEQLGVPVIVVCIPAHRGVDELKVAIAAAPLRTRPALKLPLPPIIDEKTHELAQILLDEKLAVSLVAAQYHAHMLITTGPDLEATDIYNRNPRVQAYLTEATEDLIELGVDAVSAEVEAHYTLIGSIIETTVTQLPSGPKNTRRRNVSDRLDQILTHKIGGLLIFAGVMALVFWSIFRWAKPVMDWIEKGINTELAQWLSAHMAEGSLRDLLIKGVLAGVGNVVIFLPQIMILFFFIAILEESGYMSRAAFLMDRIMSKVGLHGKSFIPLLSGYACAVPAILGTRVIENRRDRLATIMVLPLMSCSARLPVYNLMIAAFFAVWAPWQQALLMLGLYALGTGSAFGMAWLFKRTLLKGPPPTFILEMPPYRWPAPRTVISGVVQKSWQFLIRAGTVIFALSVLMWVATSYPRSTAIADHYAAPIEAVTQQVAALPTTDPAETEHQKLQAQLTTLANEQAQAELANSYAGRLGKALQPVFAPLGFDWKLTVSVTGAFFAREMAVGTLGIIYALGEADENSQPLHQAMQKDVWPAGHPHAGQPVVTPLVALAFMVFFVFCMQCLSTLAVVKRETQSWGWPVLMFVYMTLMAWLAGVLVYQGGHWLGW
jgi:ferrous iron transport protein B